MLTALHDPQILNLSGAALTRLNLDAQLQMSTHEQLPACQARSHWWQQTRGANQALYERWADAWQEEGLGDLLLGPDKSAEPAVLNILEAHDWDLVD